MFPVAPDVFHRIEFRGVGGQLLDRQPTALRCDELFDQFGTMRRQAVPHYQQLAPQVAQQMAEEIDDLSGADGARVQPEVKIQRADASSGRQYFPGEMILQHRGLSAWCPSSQPMRSFAQSALVDEDDGAPLREGFFLIRGQVICFQRLIACSLRSSALPVGRWQLQPSLRRMRQTWSSWYRTPVCCLMSSRTRRAVHSPLLYPNPSGPRLSAPSISRIWPWVSFGGRPVRSALRKPCTPPCLNCRAQRLTDCRCTPNSRATSDWLSPSRSNRAPSSRRSSNFSKSRRTPAGLPMGKT